MYNKCSSTPGGDTGTAASTSTTTLVSPALLEVLSHLKLAVAQLRLYPKDSPQVVKMCTAAFQAVARQLEQSPSLVLCQTPRGLLVDAQKLAARDFATITLEASIVSLMLDAGIRSITFRKGVTVEELLTFLEALTRKFWDVREGKEINRRLREQRVLSIAVDEVEYVALSEGDLVIKDIAKKLEGTGSQLVELLRSIESLADAAIDPEVSAQARLAIMRKLVEQDPSLLRKAEKEGYEALGDKRPGFIPLDKARQSVGTIGRLLPRCGSTETRELLRGVGHVLADAFAHDPKESALMRALLGLDVRKIAQEADRDTSRDPAPVRRALELLSDESEAPPEALPKEAETLFKELTALDRADLAARLLARLNGILLDRQPARRLAAAESLITMNPTWENPPFEAARDGFESLVRSALDSEQDPRVYSKLSELAFLLADGRLRRGEYEQALETVQLFRKHHVVKDALLPHRPDQSYRALERIAASQAFPELAAKLRTGNPVAIRIVEALDQAATRFLVSEIRKAESAPQRIQLAEIVSRIGAGAGAVLAEELQKCTVPSDTLRLLEILPVAVPESVAEVVLGSLLHHPAIAVRRRSGSLLAERAYGHAGDLLLGALGPEEDPAIRASFLEALGRLRHAEAREEAMRIAQERQEPEEVRAAACGVLGRIGHVEAIPVLVGLTSKSPRGITGILRVTPAAVRVAAVRALSVFRTHPEAREALKRITEESDGAIQAAARELLYAPLQQAVTEAQQAVAAQDVKVTGSKLSGSLSEIPIDQVCQLIAGASKTGLLTITFEGPVARAWFEDGMVTAAEFQGRIDQEAFNAFIPKKRGQFAFQPGEIAPKRRVRIPVNMVLLEAFRVADENRKPF